MRWNFFLSAYVFRLEKYPLGKNKNNITPFSGEKPTIICRKNTLKITLCKVSECILLFLKISSGILIFRCYWF